MFIVEGTIGAGKSTFLKLLATAINNIVIKLESVDNWQHKEYGQSLLAQFYENPHRWAFTFETFTMKQRVYEYLKENTHIHPLFIERSIFSGHYVFARNSFESGFLTATEWHIYQEWFTFLTKQSIQPTGFIYLKLDPAVAYERIKKRNRTAEASLPLDYLHQIDYRHEQFLIQKEQVASYVKQVPVLVLDCNDEFEENPQQFKKHCDAVVNFMQRCEAKSFVKMRNIRL